MNVSNELISLVDPASRAGHAVRQDGLGIERCCVRVRLGSADLPKTSTTKGAISMAEPQLVDPHEPVMTGENSFLRLSQDDGKTFIHRTSHWRVLWCPAGQGHVLFIESPLVGKTPRIYADNAAVARFLQRTIEVMLHKPFADESLPIVDAIFERGGHSISTV